MIYDPRHSTLTQAQQHAIAYHILYPAFVLLRSDNIQRRPGLDEMSALNRTVEWRTAIAGGLHNLPLWMFREGFDFEYQIMCMESGAPRAEELAGWARRLRRIQQGDVEVRP